MLLLFLKVDRQEILATVVWLHDLGIEHGDLNESNIVVDKDGLPSLIDLEHANQHCCTRPQPFKTGSVLPRQLEFGCDEIYNLTEALGFWRSSRCLTSGLTDILKSPKAIISFHSVNIPVCEIKSAQDLYDLVPKWKRKTEAQRRKLMVEAKRVVKACGIVEP